MKDTYNKSYLSDTFSSPLDEKEKKKKIRSLQGKIQRLQKKLVETRDEAEWYRTKDKLAEQQMRLDMLIEKSLDDY